MKVGETGKVVIRFMKFEVRVLRRQGITPYWFEIINQSDESAFFLGLWR